MLVKDIINHFENFAPSYFAESFDNVGLICGNKNDKINGALVSLDTTVEVVEEAIKLKLNLIISFHPILFNPIKKIDSNDYVGRVLRLAIKNDINIYCVHTSFDNSFDGVNRTICDKLGLSNRKILIPKEGTLHKIQTYVPLSHLDEVKQNMFDAGAGNIGMYDSCSFSWEGEGTYRGKENSKPFVGKEGILETTTEKSISMVFSSEKKNSIIQALLKSHPYETVAYEILKLENYNEKIGMGMIGELTSEMEEEKFMEFIKKKFNLSILRHSNVMNKKIKKVAVLGGSGAFAIENAIDKNADVFISSDFKYHDFFKGQNKILLLDIGHFESEQFTIDLIYDILKKKIPNFAVQKTSVKTNPVNYY